METYLAVTVVLLLIAMTIMWMRIESLERIIKILCTYITLRDEDVMKEIRKDLKMDKE